MNHKRKRPKNRRGGCLFCKPHKMNGAKNKEKHSIMKLSGAWEGDDFEDRLKEVVETRGVIGFSKPEGGPRE